MSATLLKRRGGMAAQRAVARARRHFRVRKNVNGTLERPRLVVTRSLRNITAQVVDDTRGHTLVSASSLDASIRATLGTGTHSGGAASAHSGGAASAHGGGAASAHGGVPAATRADKKAVAAKVGALIAERAKAAGISKVVFDRGGNRYAGRLASLADAAREAGLEF